MRTLIAVAVMIAMAGCTAKPGAEAPAAAAAVPAAAATATAGIAHVHLAPTQGNRAQGDLTLTAQADGVHLAGQLSGLAPDTEHGFHIHENGDCSAPDASSAGGHFNPDQAAHGQPGSEAHHAGDMWSLRADGNGNVSVDTTVPGVTLTPGSRDVRGRAIVLHAKADDYTSQPAGDSGPRIACGVIGP